MKRIVATTIISIFISGVMAHGRVVTTRKHLKVNEAQVAEAATDSKQDTLRDNTLQKVRLSGFDKPLKSKREMLFVTNNTEYELKGVILECRYYDMSGRQLHQRTITSKCNIPAGATCQVGFKSWDTQESFYYHRSAKPRKASGTPFEVKVRVAGLIIDHPKVKDATTEK